MSDLFQSIAPIEDEEFNYIKSLVYDRTGIFLAPHKKIMVQSRLNSRLRTLGFKSFPEYVRKLKTDKSFWENETLEIINKITTNKTDFFRENHHFEYLRNIFFPKLEEAQKIFPVKKLKVWCSASSTGEEPYSIAITAQEYFGAKRGWQIKIVASDIDTNVLSIAKKGIYKEDSLAVIPEPIKTKYFTKKQGDSAEYEAKDQIKILIDFQKINLLDSPYPFTEKFDVIFCRNVIIYFDKETQKRLFLQVSRVLSDDGILVLGHSETMFGISDLYKFISQTIYQKKK